MATNPDFRDLFFEFAACGVRYLVVGAYAVSHYTEPRFTKDLDVWIDPDPENALRAWRALAAYGAPLAEVTPEDLSKPGNVLQIGVTTTRIDVITGIEGLDFDACWPRRSPGKYADCDVSYLSRADLVRNKRAVGRPQDLLDVARLEGRASRRKPRRRKA